MIVPFRANIEERDGPRNRITRTKTKVANTKKSLSNQSWLMILVVGDIEFTDVPLFAGVPDEPENQIAVMKPTEIVIHNNLASFTSVAEI